MAIPVELTLTPEASLEIRKRGGTAAIDYIPPIA